MWRFFTKDEKKIKNTALSSGVMISVCKRIVYDDCYYSYFINVMTVLGL